MLLTNNTLKPSFVRLIGAQWQNRIKSYKNEFYVFN